MIPTKMQDEMLDQVNRSHELINPVSFRSEELRKQAIIDGAAGNPNLLPKVYVILYTFVTEKDVEEQTWEVVHNREQLRQHIIDSLKAGEEIGLRINPDKSYILPDGWTITGDEEWATVYDVMKHIEQFFDDPSYEPFDIEDYV
jgi:hypothetical protein